MTPYFSKFPKIAFDSDGTRTNIRILADITHRVLFKRVVKNNALIFYPYDIKEGETPDIIAAKLYGSAQYHWIILFANELYNLWTDWPLDYFQFVEFLIKKYGSIDTSQTTIDHYLDVHGNVIDQTTYAATISEGSTIVYAFEHETNLNTAKKTIKLIDPKYVPQIELELDRFLS